MDPEQMFVSTLEDLHRSINSLDEYEVLRASHLIRQLLLDGAVSLVDQVNRTHRLRIEYLVTEVTPPIIPGLPAPHLWCAIESIDPRRGPPTARRISLRWDKLQKMTIAVVEGHKHDVHDVIVYCAHIAGGVHMGSPKTDQERALAKLQARFPFMNSSAIASMLRAIGRVILAGLRELKDRVMGIDRFESGPGISIYTALAFSLMPGAQENYIFDIGVEQENNRITVFIDAHGELCVRVFGATGRRNTLRVGYSGLAYHYDEPMYLACEIGQHNDAVLMNVGSLEWEVTRVFQGVEGPNLTLPIHFVAGSDMNGKCRARMSQMEIVMVHNVPSHNDRQDLRNYFNHRLATGYGARIQYEPGQFMYSKGHPNFPAGQGAQGGDP